MSKRKCRNKTALSDAPTAAKHAALSIPSEHDNRQHPVNNEKQGSVTETEMRIEYNGKVITGIIQHPQKCEKQTYGIILTHGAGGDHTVRQLQYVSEHLVKCGYVVLRFTCKGLNITYRSKVYLAVLKHFHSISKQFNVKGYILGGRSMGSRAAINVANQVYSDQSLEYMRAFVSGVCCLAYPLHPPKQETKLRDEPLQQLKVPSLFITGTNDQMARQDLLIKALEDVPDKKQLHIHWLEGVDHGQKGGRNEEQALEAEISQTVSEWISELDCLGK